MVMRVQKIKSEPYVALTAEAMEHLGLQEGQAVEVKVEPAADAPAAPTTREVRYITAAEALESFERTMPFHRNTYQELAK